MRILSVASEMVPYSKTGGLADVVGALPVYLRRFGHDIRVFTPLYDKVDTSSLDLELLLDSMSIPLGPDRYVVKVFRDRANPTAYLVHCPALYFRGSIYTNHEDEHRRYLVLCYTALYASQRMGFQPQVIHCHDWQGAMMPLIVNTQFRWDRLFQESRTLLTIHNLNYQGSFPSHIVPDLNLGSDTNLLHQDFLREGRVNFLLHGVMYADGISTVSPTYAKEIQTPRYGAGMDPFLRERSSRVVGILNGVDYEVWSPETDAFIDHHYSVDDLSGKEGNKKALLEAMGLPYVQGVPLIGIVSRMASQKGFDLLPAVMPALLRRGDVQLVVLGSGDRRIERIFRSLQARFPRQVCFYKGFSNPLAHLIEAGSDIFLMPSRYEPCGLNQLYSLRYGTVPVVHKTGGLADTIHLQEPTTGFPFEHFDARGLYWGLSTALKTYQNRDRWRQIMINGMTRDYSWTNQSRMYETLFQRLTR